MFKRFYTTLIYLNSFDLSTQCRKTGVKSLIFLLPTCSYYNHIKKLPQIINISQQKFSRENSSNISYFMGIYKKFSKLLINVIQNNMR